MYVNIKSFSSPRRDIQTEIVRKDILQYFSNAIIENDFLNRYFTLITHYTKVQFQFREDWKTQHTPFTSIFLRKENTNKNVCQFPIKFLLFFIIFSIVACNKRWWNGLSNKNALLPLQFLGNIHSVRVLKRQAFLI